VRQRIAGAIAVHQDEFFGGLDVISHPPTLDAYREYRAGLEIFQSDYARTLSHLHRSRELAPRFVPALVVMVFAYENLGQRDDSDLVIAELERTSDRLTSAERMLIEFVQSNRLGRREQARRVLEELARRTPASLLVNFNLVQCNVLVNRPQAAVIAYMRQPSISKALRHSVESYRRIRFLDALHMLGAYQRELAESRSAQADAPGVLPFVLAEARALIGLGRGAELREIVERSQSLPRTAGWGQSPGGLMEQIAHELSAHGSRAESLAMAADAVQWYRSRPAQPGAQQQYRESLARALHLAERFHEAGALFEELASAFPADLGYRVRLALIAAQTGDAQRARLLSTGLERATGPADRGRTSYDRARIAAALGERERALQLLRDAFNEGLEHGPSRHHSADFASLREYQPYQRLLRPAG
jgi:tetratricopeptide (TPR) repeat protein